MGKMYMHGQDGTPRLFGISCDAPDCDASIRPHPQIAESGWVQSVAIDNLGVVENDYCPMHAHLAPIGKDTVV